MEWLEVRKAGFDIWSKTCLSAWIQEVRVPRVQVQYHHLHHLCLSLDEELMQKRSWMGSITARSTAKAESESINFDGSPHDSPRQRANMNDTKTNNEWETYSVFILRRRACIKWKCFNTALKIWYRKRIFFHQLHFMTCFGRYKSRFVWWTTTVSYPGHTSDLCFCSKDSFLGNFAPQKG